MWHGGIHLRPTTEQGVVYAASSGTIVAARIRSNSETEAHLDFGSQRFVLIRHAVHELGAGGRVDVNGTPKYVFSLYMHLERFESPGGYDHRNPPWYNLWLRDNAASVANRMQGEKGAVFFPNIPVSVGDVLGVAGRYRADSCCLHFEIFTREDSLNIDNDNTTPSATILTDPGQDKDAYCDDNYLDTVLMERLNKPLNEADPVVAAIVLRNAKTYHISEWALSSQDAFRKQFEKAVEKHPNKTEQISAQFDELWTHASRFTFWNEVTSNSKLRGQLGDGMVWFYHPITFMECLNENVSANYTEIPTLPKQKKQKEDDGPEGDPIKFRVRFHGIRQNSGGSWVHFSQEMLEYCGWVDGIRCGLGKTPVTHETHTSGMSVPIGESWTVETTVGENRTLNIRVNCYAGGGYDEVVGTAAINLTKSGNSSWDDGNGTRHLYSNNDLFSVSYSVEVLTTDDSAS